MGTNRKHTTTVSRMMVIHKPQPDSFIAGMLECFNELSPEAQQDIDALVMTIADEVQNLGVLSGLELLRRLLQYEDKTGRKLL